MGNFFSNSAQWLQLLSVGWLVRHLTMESSSSALLVVSVGGMSTLPGLVVGPFGGVLGDRIDRRKLVIGVQTFMAVFAFLFAIMVGNQLVTVWHAFIYVIVSGTALSFTQPMRQALIANTVPRESLSNAYATNVVTIPGTRMIGPFIGGIMITTLGFFWNFTFEAALYAGTVLMLLPMRTPYAFVRKKTAETPSMLADLIEGVRYMWRGDRVLVKLFFLMLIPNALLQPVMFMLPVFTSEVLRRGADVGGFFLAVNGFGGFLAALVLASFGFGRYKGKILLVTAIISSGFAVLLAYSFWLPVAFLVIGFYAASQTIFRTTNGALVQLLVTDEFRGRITSFQRYGQGFVVITSFIVGWFAGLTSVSIALATIGVIGLITSITVYFTSRTIAALE